MLDNQILQYTFNDFFFQELLESVLSLETKRELIEFLWDHEVLTNRQYKMCMVFVEKVNEKHDAEKMALIKLHRVRKVVKKRRVVKNS